MLRSRAIWIAATVVFAVAVACIALLARGDERVGVSGGAHGFQDVAPDRPARKPPRRERRLTDAQAVERVRRITPWIHRGYTREKLIALTFDDGPGPMTPRLHAELRRLRVPATFFQVAQMVQRFPDAARRSARRPFAAGSHTVGHPHLTDLGTAAQRSEIGGGADAIEQSSGEYPRMFRAPYGYWNTTTFRVLKQRRELMVFWSISSRDWKLLDEDAIADRVIRRAHPGAIVLMHDFGGITREPTLRAVPRIVRALRRRGYRFVTVPEMLRQAPPRRRLPRPPAPYPL